MEQSKTNPILIPCPNVCSLRRRRSMTYPTPPEEKFYSISYEKIKSIKRPEKPKINI